MEYFIYLATFFALFAVFAISLNLLVGYTGLVSLAHAAFYGIGAYTTALLMANAGVNFFVAAIAGTALAAVLAFFLGFVFSRLSGDYHALGTVGLTYIAYSVALNWNSLTGGPLGIAGIRRPEIFGFSFAESALFLALALTLLVATYALSVFLVRSSFGRVLRAIREDEGAIAVFGYRTISYRLLVFVISAGIAALGGAFLGSYLRFIDPQTFGMTDSVLVLSMVLLGGAGSLRGPIIGALILVLLPEALRFVGFSPDVAGHLRQLIYGLILIGLMMYRPQGIMGEYKI
jgi:branched-chain amino acid transport system permease protein